MTIHTHILKSSKDTELYSTELRSITKSVESSIDKVVPLNNIDVVFYDNPEGTIKELGIGGFTPFANTIFISLDPRHPQFKHFIEKELPYTLIHECNHAIRFRTPIPKETLLEAIISEGLADHFAMQITKRKTPPAWTQALNPKEKDVFLKRAMKESVGIAYDHSAWFYGSNPNDIPRWTGYTIGYDLIGIYLSNNPDILASDLISSPADLFI